MLLKQKQILNPALSIWSIFRFIGYLSLNVEGRDFLGGVWNAKQIIAVFSSSSSSSLEAEHYSISLALLTLSLQRPKRDTKIANTLHFACMSLCLVLTWWNPQGKAWKGQQKSVGSWIQRSMSELIELQTSSTKEGLRDLASSQQISCSYNL